MDTEVLEKKIEALEHAQAESTMKPVDAIRNR